MERWQDTQDLPKRYVFCFLIQYIMFSFIVEHKSMPGRSCSCCVNRRTIQSLQYITITRVPPAHFVCRDSMELLSCQRSVERDGRKIQNHYGHIIKLVVFLSRLHSDQFKWLFLVANVAWSQALEARLHHYLYTFWNDVMIKHLQHNTLFKKHCQYKRYIFPIMTMEQCLVIPLFWINRWKFIHV